MARIEPISETSIARAADYLRAGRLVAFPTETVYGLGADATNDRAVADIFAAKNRPDFNPLIVHVTSLNEAETLGEFSPTALRLAARFWPGPLTLIVNRKAYCPISLLASAGLNTLALRVPGAKDARRMIAQARCPIAAPSANASGRLSPTTAQHVAASLGESVKSVALILDGGACVIGVESTVLDVSNINTDQVSLLRPGGLSLEAIEEALGKSVSTQTPAQNDAAPKSPGMLASHYAPVRPLRMNATLAEPGEALLGFGPNAGGATLNLSRTADLTEAAAHLFAFLHQLDTEPHKAIAVMEIPETGLGQAINDRLRRAAAP
ncbi:MAG: L-threonylcarbamoyladenylate synthase [Proteobacteria bacterium]|nr:L-threonylcarbamoyladenylate synthase [Pseudomonadota bacterium]